MKEKLLILSRPDNMNKYGQDYRMHIIARKLNIKIVLASEKKLNKIKKHDVIITFNCDNVDTYNVIKKIERKKIVTHFQLNPNFLIGKPSWLRCLDVLRISDKIIVPANFLKIRLKKYILNDNIYVVNNGVESDIFKIKLNNRKTLLFGYVGRIKPHKGSQILLSICNCLEDNLFFRIDSIDSEKLIFKNSNIQLTYDSIDRNTHPTPYFDCFIFPSLSEVAPLVVIESLISGVPVISTNSSPFLTYLQKKIGNRYVKLIKLPGYVNALNHEELSLKDKDVRHITLKFLGYMKKFKRLSLKEKQILRNKMKKMGFTSETMTAKINEIYQS